ncbi:MAG: response regulator [Deltaproteobacteria bacterium]|nr:response regulator [Deltaproteobacteria bacterium]
MSTGPLFPASQELFALARALADAQGPPDRMSDAEIGRIVGFESARTSRWKHGQIEVCDAAQLLALSVALDADVAVLAHVAAGSLGAAEALAVLGDESRLVGFLSERIVLAADGQSLTLAGGRGGQARVVRHGPGRYERSMRRMGGGAKQGRGRELAALLADDDEGTAEIFSNLTGQGTGVTGAVARTGPEALIAAGRLRPNLVVLDLFIIGMDGFAALRALSSHESTRSATLIATSLSVTPELERAALGCGASEVLQRPLRARALGRLVGRLRRRGA